MRPRLMWSALVLNSEAVVSIDRADFLLCVGVAFKAIAVPMFWSLSSMAPLMFKLVRRIRRIFFPVWYYPYLPAASFLTWQEPRLRRRINVNSEFTNITLAPWFTKKGKRGIYLELRNKAAKLVFIIFPYTKPAIGEINRL